MDKIENLNYKNFEDFLIITNASKEKKLNDLELENHIEYLKKDKEANRLLLKATKKIINENSKVEDSVFEEIRNLYKNSKGLVTIDTLKFIEKYNDVVDLYKVLKSIYELGLNTEEYDRKFGLNDADLSKEKLEEKYIDVANNIYKEDKYYLFNKLNLPEEYLKNNRIISIFFNKICN